MDNMKEMSDAYRRASLASSIKQKSYMMDPLETKEPPPKDTFHVVHILFLLVGIMHILPLSFFGTAYGYWMYKFRDTSSELVDLNNKTTLQTYFASGTTIVNSIPNVICMLLSTTFGHKFAIRSRVITALTIIACVFVVFTALIKVNTDPWQTGFFVLSLAGLSTVCGIVPLFQISTLPLLAKFPPSYMQIFLIGQGICGIFNACLQLFTLAIGTTTQTSAIYYFVSGAVLVLTTLILYIMSEHIPFYQYHIENSTIEDRKEMMTKEQVLGVMKDIWSIICIAFISMVNLFLTHPAITSLVVSDNYGNGSVWSDTYFVPTITFLFSDICSLIGRLTATKGWITPSTSVWWVVFTFVKAVITIPLILLCNAQPRSHLPVWFPHDWQYILILMTYSYTTGFIFNTIFFSIPKLAVGKEEAAYLIMMCSFGISGGITSPLTLLGVRIL